MGSFRSGSAPASTSVGARSPRIGRSGGVRRSGLCAVVGRGCRRRRVTPRRPSVGPPSAPRRPGGSDGRLGRARRRPRRLPGVESGAGPEAERVPGSPARRGRRPRFPGSAGGNSGSTRRGRESSIGLSLLVNEFRKPSFAYSRWTCGFRWRWAAPFSPGGEVTMRVAGRRRPREASRDAASSLVRAWDVPEGPEVGHARGARGRDCVMVRDGLFTPSEVRVQRRRCRPRGA